MKRRELLRTAGGSAAAGAAAVTAGSGAAAAAEGDGGGGGGETTKPDFGTYLDGVDGGYEDFRGESEVTINVGASGNGGNLAFKPAGIWIDPGTTVIWQWTGAGGQHNVESVEGPASFQSETVEEEGYTFEFEFTEEHAGITNYQCSPHSSLGMLGAVAVGEDVETITVGGSSAAWPTTIEGFAHDVGVPIQKHYVGIVSFLGIAVSLVFTFYVLKYGESPNTGRGGV